MRSSKRNQRFASTAPGYGDSSLDFEGFYYVQDTKRQCIYTTDIQQAINLELFEHFTNKGVAFAYPTRTLYVHHVGDREPAAGAPPTSAPRH